MKKEKQNRYEFFEFNGKYYGKGTIVKFKPSFLPHMQRENELYGVYNFGRYYDSRFPNGYHSFMLRKTPTDHNICMGSADNNKDIYRIVEKIITPVEVPYVSMAQKKWAVNDWEDDDLLGAWIVYLFVMGISAIFVFRWIIWIVASVIFFSFRNYILKQYGYK